MTTKFDETKSSVVEGFGMNKEEFQKLVVSLKLEGKKTNECIKLILEETLTDDTKMALIFEIGANFGQNIAINMMKENAMDAEMDILKQIKPKNVQ